MKNAWLLIFLWSSFFLFNTNSARKSRRRDPVKYDAGLNVSVSAEGGSATVEHEDKVQSSIKNQEESTEEWEVDTANEYGDKSHVSTSDESQQAETLEPENGPLGNESQQSETLKIDTEIEDSDAASSPKPSSITTTPNLEDDIPLFDNDYNVPRDEYEQYLESDNFDYLVSLKKVTPQEEPPEMVDGAIEIFTGLPASFLLDVTETTAQESESPDLVPEEDSEEDSAPKSDDELEVQTEDTDRSSDDVTGEAEIEPTEISDTQDADLVPEPEPDGGVVQEMKQIDKIVIEHKNNTKVKSPRHRKQQRHHHQKNKQHRISKTKHKKRKKSKSRFRKNKSEQTNEESSESRDDLQRVVNDESVSHDVETEDGEQSERDQQDGQSSGWSVRRILQFNSDYGQRSLGRPSNIEVKIDSREGQEASPKTTPLSDHVLEGVKIKIEHTNKTSPTEKSIAKMDQRRVKGSNNHRRIHVVKSMSNANPKTTHISGVQSASGQNPPKVVDKEVPLKVLNKPEVPSQQQEHGMRMMNGKRIEDVKGTRFSDERSLCPKPHPLNVFPLIYIETPEIFEAEKTKLIDVGNYSDKQARAYVQSVHALAPGKYNLLYEFNPGIVLTAIQLAPRESQATPEEVEKKKTITTLALSYSLRDPVTQEWSSIKHDQIPYQPKSEIFLTRPTAASAVRFYPGLRPDSSPASIPDFQFSAGYIWNWPNFRFEGCE